jgi:hypothetical protein
MVNGSAYLHPGAAYLQPGSAYLQSGAAYLHPGSAYPQQATPDYLASFKKEGEEGTWLRPDYLAVFLDGESQDFTLSVYLKGAEHRQTFAKPISGSVEEKYLLALLSTPNKSAIYVYGKLQEDGSLQIKGFLL